MFYNKLGNCKKSVKFTIRPCMYNSFYYLIKNQFRATLKYNTDYNFNPLGPLITRIQLDQWVYTN